MRRALLVLMLGCSACAGRVELLLGSPDGGDLLLGSTTEGGLLLAAPDAWNPASSLSPCGFELDAGCTDPAEACRISQICGIGTGCDPVTGDRLCHRLCAHDTDCSATERCEAFGYADRHDAIRTEWLCVLPGDAG